MSEPIKLEKITLRGFKSIRELANFELNNLNILVGVNGSGKSNFVEFFRVLSAMMKKDGLKEYISAHGGPDEYLYGGPKITDQVEAFLRFDDSAYSFHLNSGHGENFIINNEYCYYLPAANANVPPKHLGSGNLNPQLLFSPHNNPYTIPWYCHQAMASWKLYHFHDTSITSGPRRYQEQSHNEYLAPDAANIAPYLLKLREQDYSTYQEILGAVRLALPFFDDFVLKPSSHEKLRLEWRQKGLGSWPMKPSLLSDGSLRFICLATALLQRQHNNGLIVLDEPELGLHPEAIILLAEMIQATSKHTQVIFATQSPSLLNHFSIEDIIVVSRLQGASTFQRLDEQDYKDWLEEYTIGDLWSRNVISSSANHG